MLQALLERGVRPDLVVGTSVGALNGAAIAADPSVASAGRLRSLWTNIDRGDVFGGSFFSQAASLVRTRTHIHSNRPLRKLIETTIAAQRFEDLAVPFQCVAACIERAAEHWFADGPLVDAILASCAVPGVLPVVRVGDEHFVDGGIVNSIPIGRSVELGADVVYVLHVGRIERPLSPPKNVVQAAMVAFEIARRHRVARDLATLPPHVVVHVLPTGDAAARNESPLRYREFSTVSKRIERAYRATSAYLDG